MMAEFAATRTGAAQSPAPSSAAPQFEVVSIKPNQNAAGPMGAFELAGHRLPLPPVNGRLRMTATTASLLVQHAYNVKDFQLLGAPGWIHTERFDIDAIAADGTTFEQTRVMLQAMLADRFKLAVRRETRTLPVYELAAARGGMKIRPLKDGDCVTPVPGKKVGVPFGPLTECGGFRRQIVNPSPDRIDRIDALGLAMPAFVEMLSNEVGRTVVDTTSFAGLFNVRLEFAPDLPGFDTGPSSVRPSASVAPGLTLFTALQEQLGLRLVPAQGPVNVVVIDRVERPSEN